MLRMAKPGLISTVRRPGKAIRYFFRIMFLHDIDNEVALSQLDYASLLKRKLEEAVLLASIC